jgi:hypothetical protein
MKAAQLNRSKRLQRVRNLLLDGIKHSTQDIVWGAHVMAVSACVSELRANGCQIECERVGDRWYYWMKV